jgi:hypothetical protein
MSSGSHGGFYVIYFSHTNVRAGRGDGWIDPGLGSIRQ